MKRNYDKLAVAADQSSREREFWLNLLAGELVKSGFLFDHIEEDINDCQKGKVEFKFTGNVADKLKKLSKGSDVKLHMILLASLVTLLELYTGNRDIILGSPIYRQKVDTDFINTVLTIRTFIQDSMTFRDLLMQIRENIVQAVEHQNYPIEILLEQLGFSFTDNDFPLFDIIIMHEGIHEIKYIQHIPYNVLFNFQKSGEGINGTLTYNLRRYRQSTINRIINQYLRSIEIVTTDVDKPVTDIDILSDEEKQRLIYEFNDTYSAYTVDKSLHQLLEERVKKEPDRIALVSEESLQAWQLTFRELNERANRLARLMQLRGVKPGSIVAMLVDRCLGMMVGIWGILKAGGAYLNIDLAYPEGRTQYMLKESGTSILLTYARHEIPMDMTKALTLECIDIFSPHMYTGDPANLAVTNRIDDAAYIIYTSGSTGRPKGVVVEHQNVVAYLHAFYREFDLTGKDIALQQASYAFDAFVEEVYPVMLRGGKVAICPRTSVIESDALGRFIRKHLITFVSVSPLLLNELNKLPDTDSIRIFISGGDVLKREYLTDVQARDSIYNTYGPTETTVCATYYRCCGQKSDTPPIGRPIANYEVLIRDRYGRFLPIGVPGELFIAGPGVTRGYMNNPELTQQKFITVPSSNHQSLARRMYKTGDLCRWLPDGNIEFIGRIDRQVKIRGFRIELDEIENQLVKHETIDAVKVMTRETEDGEKIMVAYVGVSTVDHVDGISAAIPIWREFLAGILPQYMIPSHFVILDRIPLTSSGKPDLRALYSRKPITGSDAEFIEPATDIEMTLAEIWKELLQLNKVGIHDNFFDLGGNSIMLLKAANKMREAFKRDIPYVAMFQYSTIHSLAAYLKPVEEEIGAVDRKYMDQADALNRGKTRVKKLIKKAREVVNG